VTVILVPVSAIEDVQVNWWNWRPTVELLRRDGVITAEHAERMHVGMGAMCVPANLAMRIADAIEVVLPTLSEPDERVLLDGAVTAEEPFDPNLPGDSDWYGARRAWLQTFLHFCRASGGFTVA
jgi:hypothetical protein